ncbi:CRISPR-associated protein Csx16 [Thiocystis violascens]|uniref:CRISPR-associated protein Csx16 n=1 Tax=Thiocystis violascens TaxID=73141 RepID=UPI000A071205|nr:CRISPR-associated protein Csx16 [Thiocystis violascens]
MKPAPTSGYDIRCLDPTIIQPGDTLIGSLPVNLSAEIRERGGRYPHLSLDLPAPLRGQELSAAQTRDHGHGSRNFASGGATSSRLTATQACGSGQTRCGGVS